MDKITNDARVYTDVQGLEKLRAQYKSNPNGVKKEVAQQFEALFVQMLMRSMREANESFSSGLFSSSDMSIYQDMFDKQLSLSFSQQGLGIAKMIEENIDHQQGVLPDAKPTPTVMTADHSIIPRTTVESSHPAAQPVVAQTKTEHFATPKEFIHKLTGFAKQAAQMIGVHPAVLLAQAALETDWGKKIIAHNKGGTSYNLFNIKSDPNWRKDTSTTATLEQKNGVIVKQHASFKNYDSFHESFMDYVNLISKNPRYQKAMASANEPKAYAQALQEAGYATDSNYANKIMNIMKSQPFHALLAEEKIF